MEEQGMIERVARAICSELDYDLDNPAIAQFRGMYLRMARAAIEAMRIPSQAMMDAGDGCCGEYGCGDYRMKQIFSAMIDAALNDQERT